MAPWLDQDSLRVEAVFTGIHQRIDAGEFQELERLTKAVSVLESERDSLHRISTWPWQPERLGPLGTALTLPPLMWISQFAVQLLLNSQTSKRTTL